MPVGESSLPLKPLSALLRLTQSCRFHDEDENEDRGLCGLHKPYNSHGSGSHRSMYPWAASVNILVNIHSSLSSSSRSRRSAVTTTIMLLAVNFLMPFRKAQCGFHAAALWWHLSLCWLLPTASPLEVDTRTWWLTLTANCAEVGRNSAWVPLHKQIQNFLSDRNLYLNSKSLFWVSPDSQTCVDPPAIQRARSHCAGCQRVLRLRRGSHPTDGGGGRLPGCQVRTTSNAVVPVVTQSEGGEAQVFV